MAVTEQLTGQKLEENPVLPLDQKNLVYTLTRIFRVLAQIVNPLVAWAASWKGIAPSGSTWGNSLVITSTPPETGPGAALLLQASAPTGSCVIAADRPPYTRIWDIVLCSADAAGDFRIDRFNNAGVGLGTAFAINRSTGVVYLDTPTGALVVRGNAQSFFGGTVTAASGMGFHWDGANANYLCMGAGIGSPWSWQWDRTTGMLRWLNGTSVSAFSLDGSGNVATTGVVTANGTVRGATLATNGTVDAGGRITSTVVGDIAAIYAPSGGIYTDWNNGAALRATAGGVTVHANYGLSLTGYYPGGTVSIANICQGNPNWSSMNFRYRHQHGAWAGLDMLLPGGNEIDFSLSGTGAWGVVRAAAFEVQSDAATKQSVRSFQSALDVLDGIQAHTYEFVPKKRATNDKTPIYGKTRFCGTMAQDWLERLPEAVTETVTQDGTETLMLDYAAIGAVTAQGVSELLARVKTLESRIAAMDTKGSQP